MSPTSPRQNVGLILLWTVDIAALNQVNSASIRRFLVHRKKQALCRRSIGTQSFLKMELSLLMRFDNPRSQGSETMERLRSTVKRRCFILKARVSHPTEGSLNQYFLIIPLPR